MTGTDAIDARRALVDYLNRHPLVEDVDYTRDGYQTVLLELGDPEGVELETCEGCGALGLPERIEDHDCREFKENERVPQDRGQ